MSEINKALGQVRPILSLVGSVLIVIALAKFFGVSVPMRGGWMEIGAGGFLIKHI